MVRPGLMLSLTRRASRLAGLGVSMVLTSAAAVAAPVPYPQAVSNGEAAARAVLARAGAESCLRGKLTRALLGLSSSCEASGTRNPLCSLADKAVVVTPMTLSFMDETSQQLLDLIRPDAADARAAMRPAAPEAERPEQP